MTISSINLEKPKTSRPIEPSSLPARQEKDKKEEQTASSQSKNKLHHHHHHKPHQTLAESTEIVAEKNISSLRNFGLAGATLAGVSMSSIAFLCRIFSKEPDRKDGFAKQFEVHAKRTTAISYSIFALINTVRAMRAKDLGLAVSNFLEIPISIFSAPENLTLNRGLSIGLGNIAMEAQRISSKASYKDYGEGINYLTKSLQKIYDHFKLDPFRTILDMRHGYGSVIFSGVTALAPFVKKLTGSDFLAYNIRHWPGIIMEFGKINPVNLQRGAYNYWTCGVMMFLSSTINLVGGIFKDYKHTTEILTWIPNILGRRLLAAANISRETSRDRKAPPVTMPEAFKYAFKEIMHANNARPVLKQLAA